MLPTTVANGRTRTPGILSQQQKQTDKSQSYVQYYPEHASATDSFYETLLTLEKRRRKLSGGKLNFVDE